MAVVVVYGGGFQPFHAGHLSSYVEAKRAFPDAEFFVAASNDIKQRPIPFKVKKFLAQQAGVRDAFVEVRQPLNPKEILETFDPAKDIFVLVRSERDPMPYTKKDGSPAYFQPFVSLDQCEPFGKHAYVLVTGKKVFKVNGQEVYSGSQVRDMYTNADDESKMQIISQLYPKSTHKDTIKQVLDQYLQSTPKTVLEPKVPAAKQLKNKKLAEMIKQARPLLKEASLEKKVKFLKLLKEYAIRSNEPDDNDDAETFFKFAKMWYNGNDNIRQSVEQTLASVKPIGYEIGEIESEEGGAFVVQSGDENGRTYIGWSESQLKGIEEAFRPTYGQTMQARNKIAQQTNPARSKFVWKRPNQIAGSHTEQELMSLGFRKSIQNNVWGGTQEMWNRLLGSLNEFVPPDSGRDDGGNDRSRRIRKLLEIAIQVAKEKNVDELGMIHAMNMIAGDDFFNTAVEGILPDITDKEYMFVLQSAYKTVKQGLAEAKKKRKKKSKKRSLGRYFFPGYSYYGGGGESGESGGDGGGEGMAEGSLNELAPGGSGGGDDDKYIPPDFGKPYAARYLGKNEFEVFCRRANDPSNVIKLRAIVQKYGLEFDDDDYDEETGEGGRWFLDSPGAVWLGWQYGEIPLPKAIDQARNPGHIHDLVTDYLTYAHGPEIQKIATEYFGFTMDGDMNESMDYIDEK